MARDSRKDTARGSADRWLGILVVLLVATVAVGAIAAFLVWPRGSPHEAESAAVPVASAVSQPPAAVAVPPAAVTPPALKTQQVGDWLVVCPAASPSSKDCFAQQQLRTRDQKQLVLAWTIRRDSDGVVHAVWEVPADVVRERGMVIDLGDGKPKGLAFSGCTDQTCAARAVLAPDYLGSIEGAASIEAAVSATGRTDPVRFKLSSKGLADALDQLSGG